MPERFIGILIICAIVIVFAVWRERRAIARRLDSATVTTLATGLKVSRKIASSGRRYRDRIIDRADH